MKNHSREDLRRTPQQKKALSLARDRRNTYGANDKASRKAIPRRKAADRRSYRHAVNQRLHEALAATNAEQADRVEADVLAVRRRRWRKFRDSPLGAVVSGKVARRRVDEVIAAEALRRRRVAPVPNVSTRRGCPLGWALDPKDVSWSSGGTSWGELRPLPGGGAGWAVKRKGDVSLAHRPTGIEERAEYASGFYTKREFGELRKSLLKKLWARLEIRVARHLRLPEQKISD